jgi:branched-chain amino acid transport system permease protein
MTSVSDLGARVAALRKKPVWYADPRLHRLLMVEAAVLLLALLTTDAQGSQLDYLHVFKEAWFSGRGLQFLLGGLIVWAVAEAWRTRGIGKIAARAAAPAKAKATGIMAVKPLRLGAAVAGAALVVALPNIGLFNTPYFQGVLADQVGIFVLLAIGLNVVVGWAGLLDLGYVAFFAIGSYTCAFMTGKLPVTANGLPEAHPPVHLNPFLAFPIAVLVTLTAGLLLGAPTLRLRGDYLAIVTLGFHEIVYRVALNDPRHLTNGDAGAFQIPHFSINLFGIHYDWAANSVSYWYLLCAIIALVVFLFRRLEHSKVGRSWAAIREDEVAAAANGVPTVRYKLMAFSIGASTSGFAGVIFASELGSVSPGSFQVAVSIFVLAYVIFGGMGSLPGVIIGASLLTFLPAFLTTPPSWVNGGVQIVDAKDIPMWLGVILVTMMLFRPQGLIPSRRRRRELRMEHEGVLPLVAGELVATQTEGV